MTDPDDVIDVALPGSAVDPRAEPRVPDGVRIHRVPELHPEDVEVHPSGIPITSPSRTLIDLAEILTRDELRGAFAAAHRQGLLDMAALRRSRGRVEWRPSLEVLDAVIAEVEAQLGQA